MTVLAQMLEQVSDAVSGSTPVSIVGGNSKHGIGREQVGEPISVSEYSGVVDYQPTELVVTVRAGTKMAELREVLAEKDQMLACETPEFDGVATVGGALACAQSGPSRPWWGSIRDQVLGVRLINGKAEHLRFGGQVMKNVAGYDVSRLQVGAMGAFGILTEVSLKVLPRPEGSKTVRRQLDADAAIRVMNEVSMTPLPLAGACWFDGDLYLRLAGQASVINALVAELEGDVLADDENIWAALREQSLPFFAGAEDLWRLSVRANSSHLKSDGDCLIDWGGARRWLSGTNQREELERFALSAGGEVTQVRGGDRGAEIFPALGAAHQVMLQRLKLAFDPGAIFNRGRLYSWL
jgi:glycolate oxidase FAD binding subunit